MSDPVKELHDAIQIALERGDLEGTPITNMTKVHIETVLTKQLVGKMINGTSKITKVTAERVGDTSEYSIALTLDPPLDWVEVKMSGLEPDDEEDF